MEKAIFAAGCFWKPEAVFAAMPGVLETEVGYIGGTTDNPTDTQIYAGGTGHAEAVRITYDGSKTSYADLVEKFFSLHDPTQMNRQGPDVGDQYRSAIFFLSHEQERIARAIKDKHEQSGKYKKPIATIIEPAKTFWRAEEYHQKFLEKRGGGSCHI